MKGDCFIQSINGAFEESRLKARGTSPLCARTGYATGRAEIDRVHSFANAGSMNGAGTGVNDYRYQIVVNNFHAEQSICMGAFLATTNGGYPKATYWVLDIDFTTFAPVVTSGVALSFIICRWNADETMSFSFNDGIGGPGTVSSLAKNPSLQFIYPDGSVLDTPRYTTGTFGNYVLTPSVSISGGSYSARITLSDPLLYCRPHFGIFIIENNLDAITGMSAAPGTTFPVNNQPAWNLKMIARRHAKMIPRILPAAAQGPAPLTVNFSDNTVVDNGLLAYLWTFGDSTSSTLKNPPHTFAYGIYTVTMRITDESGDVATTTAQIRATVKSLFHVGTVAGGGSVRSVPMIFDTPSNVASYAWTVKIGAFQVATSTLQNPTFTLSIGTPYDITCKATGTLGDTDTSTLSGLVFS